MPEAIPIRKPVSVNAPEITATRRVYALGFNRCGTRSLTTALKQAGIGCVHWDRNQLMLAILGDLRRHLGPCRRVLAGYLQSDCSWR